MKNEPQRPAEPFDPHANEENFFAMQEHELVEQKKREHRYAEALKRQEFAESCPQCSGKMGKYSVEGVDVERCEICEGIWLNKGELAEILRRQAAGPLGAFLERCFARVK